MKTVSSLALAIVAQIVVPGAVLQAWAQGEGAPYPAMAPLREYLMPSADSEIALARSAAPRPISDSAGVMVLGPRGYRIVTKGTNGFVCLVERSWMANLDDPEFWNPKVRSPICFNPPAARTSVPLVLMRTRLLLAGRSKTEAARAIASALDRKALRALEPGAMCYMMSRRQYLNDRDGSWRPHLMFFVPGNAAAGWGANLAGSPVLAANDPADRMTIFLIPVGDWSDGTPAAQRVN